VVIRCTRTDETPLHHSSRIRSEAARRNSTSPNVGICVIMMSNFVRVSLQVVADISTCELLTGYHQRQRQRRRRCKNHDINTRATAQHQRQEEHTSAVGSNTAKGSDHHHHHHQRYLPLLYQDLFRFPPNKNIKTR
jgi:hypothetical protein